MPVFDYTGIWPYHISTTLHLTGLFKKALLTFQQIHVHIYDIVEKIVAESVLFNNVNRIVVKQ
jgi:hypothetical protein